MSLILADLWFRYLILITAALLWLLQMTVWPQNLWVNAAFVVSMGGIVGYFTNYLAIRMLFQPKQGKVLGWEGLVPRNKAKIAHSLGNSIQTQLLAPDIIIGYIDEKDLIGKATAKIGEWIDEHLQDRARRGELTAKIINWLQQNGPDILERSFELTEESLQRWAKSPEQVQKTWDFMREKLVRYLSSQQNRSEIASFIRKAASKEIPSMARAMNDALNEFLLRRNAIGKIGLSIKNMFSLNHESMEDVLQRFINDPETTEQILGTFDILVEEFERSINEPATQAIIMRRIKRWVDAAAGFTRVTVLESAVAMLQEYLDNEENWDKIEKYLSDILLATRKRMNEFMGSQKGREILREQINKVVQKINVTEMVENQVMKLDTDELEQMILNNTGGNLVVIQLIGGILGIIAGLIQVHHYFAFPVLLLVAAAWVSAILNRRKFRKAQDASG